MSLIASTDNSTQQKINELEQKIQREKAKLDKDLTRKKILLGAFLIQVLEDDSVKGMRQFTAENLDNYLSRNTDKALMSDVIENLKKELNKDNNAQGFNHNVDNSAI